jgi:hypothetical protein
MSYDEQIKHYLSNEERSKELVRRVLDTPRSAPTEDNTAAIRALHLVVGVLAGSVAKILEASTGQPAGTWINQISAICQEAVIAAPLTSEGRDVEKLKRGMLDHINLILGTIKLDGKTPGAN